MPRSFRLHAIAALALGALAACGAGAQASASTSGGVKPFDRPDVTAFKCGTGDRKSCPRGQVLRLSGENLARTKRVIFLGRRGSADDRSAPAQEPSPHRVLVEVPRGAHSGPLRVVAATASARAPSLRVLPAFKPAPLAVAATAINGGVFPVQGKHDYGTAVNGFGGGRKHEGQDILAKCGLPLVAALPGVVTLTRFEERAGNYIVIKADDGTSQAYMHLKAAATLAKNARVVAGQPIGQVGRTGDASACHLHFELWTAPGWYEGGSPVDPLPALRSWDPQH